MTAYLVSLGGHADIPIDRILIVVGRHPQCDARLDSRQVSRHHCCLALDRDGVLVRDLDSTNGTWINRRRVDVGLLARGDELSIAHFGYRLEARESDGVEAPAGGRGPSTPDAPDPQGLERSSAERSSPRETLMDDSPRPDGATARGPGSTHDWPRS